MELITTSSKLRAEFIRLIKQYKYFYWISAWASAKSEVFNELLSHSNKIGKIVIGIHFYQTDPDFIEVFLENEKVRFVHQPNGTFHPKLYLFVNNEKKWELLIGSANFTNGAFTENTETCLLLSNEDDNATKIYNNAKNFVDQSWNSANYFDSESFTRYGDAYKIHYQKIKSISGLYGSKKKKSKPIYETRIATLSWADFMNEVHYETSHTIDERLKVIEISQALFKKVNHFKELADNERKFIAGLRKRPEEDGVNSLIFGSMLGSGDFKHLIIVNNEYISKALDQIPLYGPITKLQYEKYINLFKKAFTKTYNEKSIMISPATRLLCMKRPDTFVCFDSQNRTTLCEDFEIKKTDMDYNRYWDDIVVRIFDCNWWANPSPKNAKERKERKVSEARAAFLDSLYYNG